MTSFLKRSNRSKKTRWSRFWASLPARHGYFHVSDFIRGTFPQDLVERLDLDSLSLESNSYLTEGLDEYFSDIVYACDYRSDNVKKGIKLKISLLFEHKSYPVKYPHLQLLRYMLGIWEKQIKSKLGVVIPIIFYHGKRGWKKKGLKSYFKGLDPLLEVIPR